MSSDRKIILHIGLHKTGTTTIQNVLYENRDFLLRQEGILYPSLAPNLSTPLRTIFLNNPQEHASNKMADFTSEEIAALQENYLDTLEREISSSEWDTLLLSAEGVSNLSTLELAKLREWGEKYASNWTILVCVRHPVEWARSVIQQSLRRGDTLQQLYEEPPVSPYRIKISRFISAFSRESVRVFDFETAIRSDGGIVGAFAQQAGLAASSSDFLASKSVHTNESLSLEAVHILSSLNCQRPIFADGVRASRRAGPGHELPYLARIEGRKFDVPEPVKKNIRLQSRDDVAWLNETFGLDLYQDVMSPTHSIEDLEEPLETLGAPAIDSIAKVFGELMTSTAFHRAFNQGTNAFEQSNLEHAERMFREAARLDPDAPQPKKMLEEVVAKKSANTGEPGPQEKKTGRKNRASFLRRLLQ